LHPESEVHVMIPSNSQPLADGAVASSDLLERIEAESPEISAQVTKDYLAQHPGLDSAKERHIRTLCKEDMTHHISYLESALRCGVPEVFSRYTAWLRNVLESRNLDTDHTKDALETLRACILDGKHSAQDRELFDRTIRQGISAFVEGVESNIVAMPARAQGSESIPCRETSDFARSLMANDRARTGGEIEAAMQEGKGLATVSVGLIQPAMYEVGRLWQHNEITVAQEHLATSVSQSLMAKAFGRADFQAPVERTALFSCVEGNFHTLGLRMVSDAFEVEGWDVDFLGGNTPISALIEMVDRAPVDLVGLSISLYVHYETLVETIGKMRAELGSRCPSIAVGGLPLNASPGLINALACDAWFVNAEEAVRNAS